jgi:hypothetical protein
VTSQLEKDLEDKKKKKWVNSIDNLEEKLEEIIEDNLDGSKISRKLNNDELKFKERFLKKIIKNDDVLVVGILDTLHKDKLLIDDDLLNALDLDFDDEYDGENTKDKLKKKYKMQQNKFEARARF